MRRVWRTLLGATCMMLSLGLAASADTLQMKNGEVVQGKYLGGSERAVQFEVNGKIQLYTVDQILSITFTGIPSAAETPAAATGGTEIAASPETGSALPTVPAGTHLMVRMIDAVDSETNHVGDRFRASLESDLVVDGTVIAPKGTDVYGPCHQQSDAAHHHGRLRSCRKGPRREYGEEGRRRRGTGRHHRSDCRRRKRGGYRGGCRRRRWRGGKRGDQRRSGARAQRDPARFPAGTAIHAARLKREASLPRK
jgi:hypothetical protein